MNNLTSNVYRNMWYKPHIQFGCLVEGGFVLLLIKLEFVLLLDSFNSKLNRKQKTFFYMPVSKFWEMLTLKICN